ncbi:MAG: hypothetical protein V4556_10680 [Bacteroidota bacterium]
MTNNIPSTMFCANLSLHQNSSTKNKYGILYLSLKTTIIILLLCLSITSVFAKDKSPQTGIPQGPKIAKLYTSLFSITTDGRRQLTDGVANSYYSAYCNNVDEGDAPKFSSFNTRESMSIVREGKKLAVEKRVPIVDRDSIFLDMDQMYEKEYELQFAAQNFDPSLTAYLKDEFTGLTYPIDILTGDTTKYTFTISSYQPASKSANRFMIIFNPLGHLPVNFTNIKAYENKGATNIEWAVENEINIEYYTIERSKDGLTFNSLSTKQATIKEGVNKLYNFVDANAITGISYYRIVSVSKSGTKIYSKIIKMMTGNKNTSSINVYPTVINDGAVTVQFNNAAKGIYLLRLVNATGQVMYTKAINHMEGSSSEIIRIDNNSSKGICQLNIAGPGNKSYPSVKLINR